ncbi:hypothetical protein AUR64_16930 [Haloprofundus marisrubri]|uniref:Uncharacterized protein n=1 Tax=Haloprofundus marisrubri TaxID=1514971 RepID=A0A0W1R7Q1_9EURY|nr:hypothetical protein [Haloprofundus marisrubri]KTG09459.1 hypothetical protein AUR64_16930 [Haloprofundus marisrubri]
MSTSSEDSSAEKETEGSRGSEESRAGRTASDGGYVHRPDGEPRTEPEPSGFGDRGWALVAAVVLSFLVVPGVIYLVPGAPGELGLSFFAAMLALPLVPALILGLTAVWSMTAATRGEK